MKIHVVTNVDYKTLNPKYICTECPDWETRDLAEVARHVAANQFRVEPPKVKPKTQIHN